MLRGTTADTLLPGTVFRFGPVDDAIPSAPIVEGRAGQATLYEGYFSLGGCDGRLRPDVRMDGDTVIVTLRPRVLGDDVACDRPTRVMGYGLLVGTLPVGDHAIRLIHAEQVGAPDVDTVYHVTIGPPEPED